MPDWLALLLSVAGGTLRVATPLILCAMGGLLSERAGIVDIGLDGKMLLAAFAAASAAAVTGSAFAGLAAGCGAALGLALVHGYASITAGGNQVVSGVALNILAAGLTVVLGHAWFAAGGATPPLPPGARFMPGPGGLSVLTWLALGTVPLVGWVVARTRFGLRLRAAGEEPAAVAAAGIGVASLRYRAVLLCGLLTGIAGTFLSISQNAGFSRDMTAGAGYIALAAVIAGRWRPGPTLAACLLFGLVDAVAIRLQGVRLPVLGEVPVQLVQVLPYVATVVLLAGFGGRAFAPKAAGLPFRPGG